ncbi:MAG: YheU family protein [Desulfobacterales bacterium]|jgi:uncharacterized protein YheU (UPF0270 family)|nr:YheU family protein [Desulfobacterales bacterium]
MMIPFERIAAQVLDALIEEFVTREGTDSGYIGESLDRSVADVRQQLFRKEAYIVYEEKTKEWNIVSRSFLTTHLPNKV